MDCFIKKIFDNNTDDFVHVQFQKFSKGTFGDKALIKGSKSAKGFSLVTGSEYGNELVRAMAEKLGKNKAKINGPIISTQKLKENPIFQNLLAEVSVKQFAGVKQHILDTELTGDEILKYLNAAPDAFFALSFNVGDSELKIKPKTPKSAKPSTSEKPATPNFCKLKTGDENLVNRFIIEKGWKKIEANHTFVITDIILPSGVSDLAEIRKKAKRKGKIIRKALIDGKEVVKEKDFIA